MEGDRVKALARLLASARNTREIASLLGEILTPQELTAVSERLQIIKMLLKGSTQREVRDQLNVSIATVSRGARLLQEGGDSLRRRLATASRK